MKVAVSSKGKDLNSAVDPRFGRANYLVIVDTASFAVVEVIDNSQTAGLAYGAGISAAGRIAEAGAQAIITGLVGPKAEAVCEKAGIFMSNGASGTVGEAVSTFIRNFELEPGDQTGPKKAGTPVKQGTGLKKCQGKGKGGRGGGMGQGRCRNI